MLLLDLIKKRDVQIIVVPDVAVEAVADGDPCEFVVADVGGA